VLRLASPAASSAPRLPGGCATRRARRRVHACEPGQRTPALCRGLAFGRSSRTLRRARHPLDVAPRRALAREAKIGTWHTRRRLGMPRAFRRTPGRQRARGGGGLLNLWTSGNSNLSGPPHGTCDPPRPSNGLFSTPLPWTWTSGWFPGL
jgi:hypothetical protein